ncbi:MAG TPA: hypothetical protein VGM88_16415 [Kofleriaceae bacterium]|jgi:hypothetical protein
MKYAIGLLLAVSGCGLISSDVTDFDLTLPDKSFSIDASNWMIDQSTADTYTEMSCESAPTVCATAAQTACPMNCVGSCDGDTHTCDLTLAVSLYQPVDLYHEKPELQTINSEPIIKVTIDSVTYDVTGNTLSVDTPPLVMYVSPMAIMDPSDPQAIEIATIAPITAGQTVAEMPIAFTDAGKAALVNIMGTFKTPFNVLVGSSITVKAGDPVPTGKLDAVVHIKAHASL